MLSDTKYQPLPSSESKAPSADDEEQQALHIRARTSSRISTIILCVLVAVCSGTAVGLIDRYLASPPPSAFLLAPYGKVRETWTYNRTFSGPPSDESEEAWRSIFPRGRGFFHHPTLDVNISGIAVFHELHCLSGIRNAYYAALSSQDPESSQSPHHTLSSAESTDPDAKVDALNAHNDPHHVRHCFDYLRRALMCAADTNLERIDWHVGGSTGWGFERTCRDYDAVVRWADTWRWHSQTEIQ